MITDDSAAMVYLMWREEQIWNVTVLQIVRLCYYFMKPENSLLSTQEAASSISLESRESIPQSNINTSSTPTAFRCSLTYRFCD
jgi:hypothetical protein